MDGIVEVKPLVMIAVAIPAVALLIWGGIQTRDYLQCKSLETDYLNSVGSLRSNAGLRITVPSSKETEDAFKRLEKLDLQRIETTLEAIYDHCGKQAGETAARKGSEMVF